MLKKILIAVGDSLESAELIEAGFTLAEKFGAEIAILHVLNLVQNSFEPIANPFIGGVYPLTSGIEIAAYQQEFKECEQRAIEQLRSYSIQAENRHLKAETFQQIGDAGQIICETAKNCGADLIVIGRHQKSILSEVFLGSTSNYVLHHAPCSAMVIQHPLIVNK
jgi:nucleotide-binding universal stress UspA family protein